MRAIIAFFVVGVIAAPAAAGPREEQFFVTGLAMASAIESGCPVLMIDEDLKRAYMRSIGITDADFGSRLLGPFIDKVAEFEARTSRAAAPVLCRVGEEKFGAQGTLWPRLLKPAQ
jgi:hypothetical protein